MINEIISKIAEEKLKLSKWKVTMFISSLSDDYLANECLITLKSGKKEDYSIFLKVSRTASKRINRFLEGESDTLRYLLSNNVNCVPRMIDCGYLNGCAYLAEEGISGAKLNPKTEHLYDALPRIKESMNEIYDKTRSKDISSRELLNKADNYLEVPSEYFELSSIMKTLEDAIPGEDFLLPTALVHGNLTSNNIVITSEGKIKILNFMASGFSEPPIDIPFFILNSKYLRNGEMLLNPIKALNEYQSIRVPQKYNAFLTLYSLIRSLHIKTEILKTLEDELLIRDLKDLLFSSMEIQTLLEINLNLNFVKCLRQTKEAVP